MIAGLEDLVGAAGPGDVLVFQYAGHGSQAVDRDGDEGDGYDEAFVPVDYHLGHYLLDDDLAAVLRRLAPGARLTLFMDCCHSGTISRFSPALAPRLDADERVRYLPMSEDLQRAHDAFRAGWPRPAVADEASLPGVVHFAACRDEEAYESHGQGDFASRGGPARAAVARGDTNEAFIDAIRADPAARNRQHPGLMRLSAGLERSVLLGGQAARPAGGGADDRALIAQVDAGGCAARASA